MRSWKWVALAALIVVLLIGGAWKVWNECWFSLTCEDGLVALQRQVDEISAKFDADEKAWRTEHPDKEFPDRFVATSRLAHLPTVRGLFGFSFLLENGRLLSPREALGLRMGLNAELQGSSVLPATAIALVDSPRSAHQQDILWSDGRLTRNQFFDARTGTARAGRWTEEQPDRVQIDDGVALVRGGNFRLVLRRDGTVWGYGSNDFGQLGTLDENVNNQWLPLTRPVAGLDRVTAIAAGSRHAVALKSDGTVWQWGANNTKVDGQVREDQYGGRTAPRQLTFDPEPQRVPNLTNIIKIASGARHSLALDKNGVVWAWGESQSGLLGIPYRFSTEVIGIESGIEYTKRTFVDEPVQVPDLENIVDIAAAGGHSLALKQDGTVWGWGMNTSRQLGFREYKDSKPSLDTDPMRVGPGPVRPFPMYGMKDIQRIFTSASYSAMVDKNGDLFTTDSRFAYDFAVCVPGHAGRKTRIQFSLRIYDSAKSKQPLNSEIGLYALDDPLGRVDGLLPGDAGYALAALARSRAVPVFEPQNRYKTQYGFQTGAGFLETSLKIDASRMYGYYIVFDSNHSAWQRENPTNKNDAKPKAFFSFPAANPDQLEYGVFGHDRPSYIDYKFERLAVNRKDAVFDRHSRTDIGDYYYNLVGGGLAVARVNGCPLDPHVK